jgi:two-component system chemotaxis response regulator CheY
MRALVVDDSKAMRSILRMILKQAGFEVMEAQDGQKGLRILEEKGPPELALLDWNMPLMNGFELLRAVRSEHKFDGMRIMMVTTETEKSEVLRALREGADEYVMKPFTPEVVIDKLRMLGFES